MTTKDGTRKGKWAQRNREEWQALLNRFDARRDSVPAFCGRKSISEAGYHSWLGLLPAASHRYESAAPSGPSAFLDLGHPPTRQSGQPSTKLDLKLDLAALWSCTWCAADALPRRRGARPPLWPSCRHTQILRRPLCPGPLRSPAQSDQCGRPQPAR